MNQQFTYTNSKLDKAMTTEQFNQVVEAILAGKYSWACVLILRFAGYNPLHYIPYRTYNRLVKDHRQDNQLNDHKNRPIARPKATLKSSRNSRPSSKGKDTQINDLSYLEVVDKQPTAAKVRGGKRNWFYPIYTAFRELS